MARSVAKKAYDHKEESIGSTRRWKLLPKWYLVQDGMKERKYEPKSDGNMHVHSKKITDLLQS